jgi:hypothetical protein
LAPAFDPLAETLARVLVFGPLVFAGLLMAMDPSRFASLPQDLAHGIQRFRRHFQQRGPEPFLSAPPLRGIQGSETFVKLAGWTLVALGVLGLFNLLG